MWITVVCLGLGISGFPPATQTAENSGLVTAKHAVLELMSLDPGEYTLNLEYHWGGLSGNHVYFDTHDGPFEAVVEPSPSGVRITFNGWEEHPFVASAARIRMVYNQPGAARVDFVAEAMSSGEVRVRPAGRRSIEGRKVAFRLGGSKARPLQLE